MAWVRKVPTASGATAVQIAEYVHGRRRIVAHVGSAHTEAELGLLFERARAMLADAAQGELDLAVPLAAPRRVRLVEPAATPMLFSDGSAQPQRRVAPASVVATSSRLLFDAVGGVFDDLGFGVIGDETFRDLVIARVVEPTSILDTGRVLSDLGQRPASERTMRRTLARCVGRGYRDQVAQICFTRALSSGDVSLCLYDVTTLYFEAEKEDPDTAGPDGLQIGLRKVGYSKERRVDPQIVVGLLVVLINATRIPPGDRLLRRQPGRDRHPRPHHQSLPGTPRAGRHGRGGRRRDALDGEPDRAGRGPVAVHRRVTGDQGAGRPGVPLPLARRRVHRRPGPCHYFDTLTPKNRRLIENDVNVKAEPVWDPVAHPGSWRAVWAYSTKRAVRDTKNLTLQENRAREVVAGEKTARTPRFVKTKNGSRSLDEPSLARARRLVGLKGYVTNIPATTMPAGEVIASYHDLWHVEQSFRMSKTDLRARPMFSHTKDAIEAHLTIVFTALAVSREAQNRTGLAIRNLVRQLRPLRSATISANGSQQTLPPAVPDDKQAVLDALSRPHARH